jgi:6-phosphogluconolactonase
MKLAARLDPKPLRSGALSVTVCVSVLLAGCNGLAGTSESDSGSSSGGAGSGSSSGTTSSGGTTAPATFTLSGSITGLAAGATGLVIQDGVGDSLPVVSPPTSSGPLHFVFPRALTPGTSFSVTVQAQPGTPAQFCRVSAGSGVMTFANVTNVAIKCATTGKYLFVVNPFDNAGNGDLAAFTINATTGALTAAAGSPYVTPELGLHDIAVDPSGQYLYVTNLGSASVSTFGVGAGAVLTPDLVLTPTGDATNEAESITIDPAGPYLYVGSNIHTPTGLGAIEAFTLPGNGVLTPAQGTLAASTFDAPNAVSALAADGASTLLFGLDFDDGALLDYQVLAGGALQQSGTSPSGFYAGSGANNLPAGIAVLPLATPSAATAGFLYVTDSGASTLTLYRYDKTGLLKLTATYTTNAGVGLAPTGVTIDPTASYLYVSNSGSGTVSAFSLNRTTGTLSPIGTVRTTGAPSPTTPTFVVVDPSSQFLYASNGDAGTVSAFSITNGALKAIGAPVATILATGGVGGPSRMAIE